jgi:hypothetical protein
MNTIALFIGLLLTTSVAEFAAFTPNLTDISSVQNGELVVSRKGTKYSFEAQAPEGQSVDELNRKLQNENEEVVKVSRKKSTTTIEFAANAPQDRVDKILMYTAYLYGYAGFTVR